MDIFFIGLATAFIAVFIFMAILIADRV